MHYARDRSCVRASRFRSAKRCLVTAYFRGTHAYANDVQHSRIHTHDLVCNIRAHSTCSLHCISVVSASAAPASIQLCCCGCGAIGLELNICHTTRHCGDAQRGLRCSNQVIHLNESIRTHTHARSHTLTRQRTTGQRNQSAPVHSERWRHVCALLVS